MNVGTLWAHIGLDNSKLKSGAKESEKVVNGLSNSIGSDLPKASSLATKALGLLGVSFSAAYLISQVKSGIEAIDQLNLSTIQIAAQISTMQGPENVAENYQKAKLYATGLAKKLEEIDSISFANNEGLNAMAQTMVLQGVILDTNNKKQVDSFAALSNAIAMYTAGQNQAIQVRQEMRALMSGEVNQGSMLARQIDEMAKSQGKYKGGLKEIVKLGKEHGDLMERLSPFLVGISAASKDISETWESVTSSWATAKTIIKRELFADVFKDAVKYGREFVDWAKANASSIASSIKMIASAAVAATKIAIVYFALFKVAPAIYTVASIALARYQVQMALASTEMVGATLAARTYALVVGTQAVSATWALAGALGKLQIVGATVMAFFVGWEVGKWIEKNCEFARQAVVVLIGQLHLLMESVAHSYKVYSSAAKAAMKGDFSDATAIIRQGYKDWEGIKQNRVLYTADVLYDVSNEGRKTKPLAQNIEAPAIPPGPPAVDDSKAKKIASLNAQIREQVETANLNELEMIDYKAKKHLQEGANQVLVAKWVATEKEKINKKIMTDSFKALDDVMKKREEANVAMVMKEYDEAEANKAWMDSLEDGLRASLEFDKRRKEARLQLREAEVDSNLSLMAISKAEGYAEKLEIANQAVKVLKEQQLLLDSSSEDYLQRYTELSDRIQGVLAKVRELQALQEAQSNDPVKGFKKGIEEYLYNIPSAFQTAQEAGNQLMEALHTGFTYLFDDILTGKVRDWGDFFMSVTDTIRKKLTELASNMVMDTLFGNTGGRSAGGGSLSLMGFIGSLFSSGSGGGIGAGYEWLENAKGGVYAAPSLSAYSGSIVSKPTLFGFATGGVMGEGSKPEAILPLNRNGAGELGVAASGLGNTVNVSVGIDDPGLEGKIMRGIEKTVIRILRDNS